jgi:hypothetical protein
LPRAVERIELTLAACEPLLEALARGPVKAPDGNLAVDLGEQRLRRSAESPVEQRDSGWDRPALVFQCGAKSMDCCGAVRLGEFLDIGEAFWSASWIATLARAPSGG